MRAAWARCTAPTTSCSTGSSRSSAPSESFTGSSRERFSREARAAARLNHPHVVAASTTGATRGSRRRPFLVMEYVEGRSLRAELPGPGTLRRRPRSARIGAQIADALAHAHQQGRRAPRREAEQRAAHAGRHA